MRADRLLSLVLLLRNRGRMSASALARELEVSPRTVLRDIEALSTSGIPVYAERGRDGGFELLPGFTTDLTGLTADEAKALLAAGSAATSESLGMAPAFASAMRKVMAAMPDAHRVEAGKLAERIYVTQDGWLRDTERNKHLGPIQQAVFAGRRLRILYASRGREPSWRTIEPEGLVNAAGRWYLMARDTERERTYKLSRISDMELLDQPADRPAEIDLQAMWEARRADFRGATQSVSVVLRVRTTRMETLSWTIVRYRSRSDDENGWTVLEADFGNAAHAVNTAWLLGADGEILEPQVIRDEVKARAREMLDRHR